jgi:glucose/arabinose dehydrogenase
VKRYKYDAKARKVTGPGEEVVSLKGFGKGHWTRTVLFDRKAEKMYVTVGSGSNVDAGEDSRRAAINRFNPDGSGQEIVASGMRNVIGLRFLPGTDTLWAATQERDGLGDDLVPDYYTEVKPGAFYGWPYAYIGPNEDPRRKAERLTSCRRPRSPTRRVRCARRSRLPSATAQARITASSGDIFFKNHAGPPDRRRSSSPGSCSTPRSARGRPVGPSCPTARCPDRRRRQESLAHPYGG